MRNILIEFNEHLMAVAPHLAIDIGGMVTSGYVKNAFEFLGIEIEKSKLEPDEPIEPVLKVMEKYLDDL